MGHKIDNFLISCSTVIAIVTILKLSSITLSWLLLTISYNTATLALVTKTNAFINSYDTSVCISVDEHFLNY